MAKLRTIYAALGGVSLTYRIPEGQRENWALWILDLILTPDARPSTLSPHKHFRNILPASPSRPAPACVRCDGWGHRHDWGSASPLVFLSFHQEAK